MNARVSPLPYTNRRAIAAGVVIVAVLIVLGGAFVQIGPGQRGVLMTFGAVHPGVLDPGLHVKLPFVQTVVKMNVQVQKAQGVENAFSLDLQQVSSDVATNWHILSADAEWVYQHVGSEQALVTRVIQPAISDAVKATTAQYNAEDLVANRDQIRQRIAAKIAADLTQYHVVIDSVNIVNFEFSPQYAAAIEQKQVAQQRAQQAQYELDRAKVLAQQRIVEATAQSEAQKLLQQTLTPGIIQQQAIAKWDGHLPEVVGGKGVLPMIGNVSPAAASR